MYMYIYTYIFLFIYLIIYIYINCFIKCLHSYKSYLLTKVIEVQEICEDG